MNKLLYDTKNAIQKLGSTSTEKIAAQHFSRTKFLHGQKYPISQKTDRKV